MTRHRTTHALLVVVAVLLLWAAPTEGGGVLFFSEVFNPTFSDGTIKRVNTDGTGLQTLVDVGGGLRGVAVDASAGKLYWTDVINDVIRRANLFGSNPEDLVTAGLAFPNSIDLDPAGDILYWGDQTLDQIRRADLDGSNASVLLSTSMHWGATVDSLNGKLYWSTAITGPTVDIMRSNVDGSEIETVVTGVDKPGDIALDVAGGKIYWTDYVADVVRRSNLDGTDVEDLFVVGANLNPGGIALDLAEGKVYWGQSTQDNRMNIMRMNLDGSNQEVIAFDFGIVVEIEFVPEGPCPWDCQAIPNGAVDVPDLPALLATWGAPGPCDFDGDGVVAVPDLLALLANWGPCP